jgi:hypothetical protein
MTKEEKQATRQRVIEGIIDIEAFQECPNTFVFIYANVDEKFYSAIAFAKVQWPDQWDAKYGLRLATRKAIMKIVRAVIREVPLEDGLDSVDKVRKLLDEDT